MKLACVLDLAEIKDFEERYHHIIERAKLENPPPIASNPLEVIKNVEKRRRPKIC
jgi:hypothetical protein